MQLVAATLAGARSRDRRRWMPYRPLTWENTPLCSRDWTRTSNLPDDLGGFTGGSLLFAEVRCFSLYPRDFWSSAVAAVHRRSERFSLPVVVSVVVKRDLESRLQTRQSPEPVVDGRDGDGVGTTKPALQPALGHGPDVLRHDERRFVQTTARHRDMVGEPPVAGRDRDDDDEADWPGVERRCRNHQYGSGAALFSRSGRVEAGEPDLAAVRRRAAQPCPRPTSAPRRGSPPTRRGRRRGADASAGPLDP